MGNIRRIILGLGIFLVAAPGVSSNTYSPVVGAQYQSVQPQGPRAKPKQTIQQFQVAVVLPPGTKPVPGNQPPGPSSPEYLWLQVPASYLTSQAPPVYQPTAAPDQFKPMKPVSLPESDQLKPTPGVQQPVPSGDDLLRKCQKPRGQFQSDKCNKYVNCWDGTAVEQFCPEGLVFHPKGYCDYAYNVDCRGRPIEAIPPPATTVSPGQISSQAPTTAAPTVIVTLPTIDPNLRKKCLKPRGQFRSTSCNKYVNCWDEVVIEQECPEGLLFSNKGYCDYPTNVDCKDSTVATKNEETRDSDCPIDSGTFREKVNCSNYFTCIGGKVVVRYTCPEGLNFNDNLGVCDYDYRVDCSGEPLVFLPKANLMANLPKDFIQKIDNCKPGTMFPLNPQCTAACLCREGGSEVVQCPSGLAYDVKSDKCLLPHLAKC